MQRWNTVSAKLTAGGSLAVLITWAWGQYVGPPLPDMVAAALGVVCTQAVDCLTSWRDNVRARTHDRRRAR